MRRALGVEPVEEADALQGRHSASHTGFRKTKGRMIGQGASIHWEGPIKPSRGAPEPRQEACQGKGSLSVTEGRQIGLQALADGIGELVGASLESRAEGRPLAALKRPEADKRRRKAKLPK